MQRSNGVHETPDRLQTTFNFHLLFAASQTFRLHQSPLSFELFIPCDELINLFTCKGNFEPGDQSDTLCFLC